MQEKILITGASSEIGFAIAARFDKPENHLFLQAFKNEQKLIEQTKNFKAKVQIIKADLANNDELKTLITDLQDISIVINGAAYTQTDLLVSLNDEDVRTMMEVNSFAPFKICQAVIPQMLIKRKGVIINLSSISASKGNRGSSIYGGTKAFLESMSRSLAAEYGMKGIRINCVAPGAIDAGSMKDLLQLAPNEVKQSIALNKLGSADDVASLVYFLCTKEAAFINGQTFKVDGGFMRGV